MPDNFDLLVLNPADLNGTVVADTLDSDGDPNRVLENGAANSIRVQWTLTGNLINFNVLGGTWRLQAFFESIGPGPEFALPVITVPWAVNGVYNQPIPIPANTIAAGTYKMVVLLSHMNLANLPTRMAGFVELPVVRFI